MGSDFLERKVTKRQEKLVSGAARWIGFDGTVPRRRAWGWTALQNVGRELVLAHPELSDELGLVTLEMRAGKRRAEALRNLAQRTGEPELLEGDLHSDPV